MTSCSTRGQFYRPCGLVVLYLLAACAVPLPQAGRARELRPLGLGPLAQENNHIIRPGFTPRLPRLQQAGQVELGLHTNLCNTWGYNPGDYRADYGTLTTVADLSYGLAPTTALLLEVRDLARTSSYLDSFTESFHQAFGLSQSQRDEFERGDNTIEIVERAEYHAVQDEHSGSVWRTYGLGVQQLFRPAATPNAALALALETRFVESEVLSGDSPWSSAFSCGLKLRLARRWQLALGLAHAWHGQERWHGYGAHENQYTASASVEWRETAGSSFLLQLLYGEAVLRNRPPWDDPSYEVLLGWVKELQRDTRLEIGLIENLFTSGTSPDVGLHLALRWRW